MRMPLTQEQEARLLVWWVLWTSWLAGPIILYIFLVQGKPLPASGPLGELPVNLAGLVPLFVSVIIRWLVLHRATDPNRAFLLFIIGTALAEGCCILGMFLGGPYRDMLFALGLLGVVQYMPIYARKLFDPKVSGFIPNN
jgi:hypothetical protein